MDLVPTTETPRKRKHSEYHDPDYHQQNDTQLVEASLQQKRIKVLDKQEQIKTPVAANAAGTNTGLRATQLQRVCEHIRTEFQRELSYKEQQLAEIDGRLLQARQLLDKLRYQVVSEYYRKQQVTLNATDVVKVRGSGTLFEEEACSGPQLPLHPAIKKIIGKRPLQPQPSFPPERTAAVVAKQSIKLRNPAHRRAERRRQQKIKQQGIVTDHSKEEQATPKLGTDTDEQPCTSRQAFERQQQQLELNASRLNNKSKFIFVVGNTSKYIGEQSLAYKWLVYLQGKDLPKPLETYITKVRFHLHHTYRPNDIVDIHKPPFQLSRRGWGEFPIRIQLYFQENLQQKPIQLMHNIILDKSKCGLHTMGAETILEVWLKAEALATKASDSETAAPSAPTPPEPQLFDDSSKPRTISITQNKEELDDNLFAGDINDIDNIEELQPTVLVTETLKLSSPKKTKTPNHPSPSIIYLPVNGQKSNQKPNPLQVIGNSLTKKKNVVFQKAGKLYIIDPQQSKLKQAVKQQSLLKPQLSLLKPTARRWHLMQCIQHDHGYANMSGNAEDDPHQQPFQMTKMVNSHLTVPLRPHQRLEQLFAGLQFRSMRYGIEFLLRRLPLVSDEHHAHYPFMAANSKAFTEQSALRQRCFEYLRARALLQCLKQHLKLQQMHESGQEIFWSLREIVGFARLHGYTPPLKMITKGVWEEASSVHTNSRRKLSHRIQEQLNEEPSSHSHLFCSLSPNLCVENWIGKQLPHVANKKEDDQQLIDVEAVPKKLAFNSLVQRGFNLGHPLPTQHTNHNQNQSQFLCLPPPTHLEPAAELVNEMCKNININLVSEQPVPGVSQSLSLILLSHVLRMFVEKLVRRSVATKLQQQQRRMDTILPQVAANLDLLLQPQDIARAIVQCSELDFLGNGHLGVLPSMEPQT